jgi:hypothetical protein
MHVKHLYTLTLTRCLYAFLPAPLLQYLLFALLYLALPDGCVHGRVSFSSALWFSVQTAATIGEPLGPLQAGQEGGLWVKFVPPH